MLQRKKIIFICILLCISLITLFYLSPEQTSPIRVACVGDSITSGSGTQDRSQDSYPAQLARMLGKDWDVKNFGANDTSILSKAIKPYTKKRAFKLAKSFKPHIVIICLGTNDSKPENWAHHSDFTNDYIALIKKFQRLRSHPRIFLCLPPPAFTSAYGINDSIIKEQIIPMIIDIAKNTNVETLDLYNALQDKQDLYFDKIHPNTQGYTIIAEKIHDLLTKKLN